VKSQRLVEAPSRFFYLCILISSIGAFSFGCGLGFTSPTTCANKAGKSSACPDTKHLFKQYGVDCSGLDSNDTNHCTNAHKMNCDLQFSSNYQSLFGSIINFGCLAGALCGGAFVDKFGKKIGMQTACVFYVVGWLCIYLVPKPNEDLWDGSSSDASNMSTIESVLLLGRLLIGFGVGIVCCSVSNYQTEICTLEMRGMIGTVFQSFIVLGLFSVYLVGSSVPWRTLSLLCCIISASGIVLPFLIPESPVWLLTKGRNQEAASALSKVRNPEVGNLNQQLADITETAADSDEEGSEHSVSRSSFVAAGGTDAEFDARLLNKENQEDDKLGDRELEDGGISELCGDRVSRKALFIGIGLMFVQQLSGINAVMFYAGSIFGAVPGTSDATANAYSTGMQGMQCFITFASALFMDRFGRVKILLFASIGQCMMSFCLASYYLFASCSRDDLTDPDKVTSASMGVFPVVSLYGYVMFFSCGMGAIPWFVMGEIFKPNVKGIASSIATAVNWLLSFLITFSVSGLNDVFKDMFSSALPHAIDRGMGGLFLAYGCVCFCGIFFIVAFIPETKGLTITEVQEKLAGLSDEQFDQASLQELLRDDDEHKFE